MTPRHDTHTHAHTEQRNRTTFCENYLYTRAFSRRIIHKSSGARNKAARHTTGTKRACATDEFDGKRISNSIRVKLISIHARVQSIYAFYSVQVKVLAIYVSFILNLFDLDDHEWRNSRKLNSAFDINYCFREHHVLPRIVHYITGISKCILGKLLMLL